MSDLISRQAAIDTFLTELTKRERKNLLHTWSTVEVKYFITDMLERLPSAQPELKKGKWINGQDVPNRKLSKYALYCSVCYEEAFWDTDDGQQLFAYCPYCGAKMEVEG